MTPSSDPVNAFVQSDSYLTLHYRIELTSGPATGTVFADTFPGNPATLQMGSGQWAPGIEAALLGREEGARFIQDLPAADAYGDRNPDLLQRITRDMLAQNAAPQAQFEPGDMVEFEAPNGTRYSGVLKELDETSALFDFNHPLAGANLRVEVALLGVL